MTEPSRPLRWGALSTARITAIVVGAAREAEDAEFIGVASRTQERASAAARELGLDRAYGTYDELLADDDVDGVYIGLPNSLHLEWATRSLEAGKHVLCEKPLGRDPNAVKAAFDVAERAGRVLAEAFMYRFHPQTARFLELVRSGAIGTLAQVNATMTFPLADTGADPRRRPELHGGALMDVGCYCVSAARLLVGEPELVYGSQVASLAGVDDRCVGTLVFPGGVRALFDVAMDLPLRDRLEIVGTEGVIEVSDPWHCRAHSFQLSREGGSEAVVVDPEGAWRLGPRLGDAYRLQLDAVSRAARDGAPLQFGRDDAVGQARVIEALSRSAAQEKHVSLRGRDSSGG